MREYAKKSESRSHTLDSNPKASEQASVDVILQRYKEPKGELLHPHFESAFTTDQKEKPNNTGLPDNLKMNVENLSGYSMDDVSVHYNSDKPSRLNARAYTQGTDIYVAPGQEKHLPHEAWHVIQQKQGRVRPTLQLQGVNVNDNHDLEQEADRISSDFSKPVHSTYLKNSVGCHSTTVQRLLIMNERKTYTPGAEWKFPPNPLNRALKINFDRFPKVLNFLKNYDGYRLYWEAVPTPLRAEMRQALMSTRLLPMTWYGIDKIDGSHIYFYPEDLYKLTGTKPEEPLWITMGYYATGDQFSVAVTLLNDPNTNVLIYTEIPLASRPSMFDFFRLILNGEHRRESPTDCEVILAGGKRRVIYQPCGVKLDLTNASDSNNPLTERKSFAPTASVNYGTDFVASAFNEQMRTDMRDRLLQGGQEKFGHIETYLRGKCGDNLKRANIKEKDILVIWFRFSGSKGGAHPEHDTSFTLTRKIIAVNPSHYIILAGDKKGTKTSAMVTERVFDLTEFWNDADAKEWKGDDRIGQLNLYEYFKAHAKSVKHIGSRSGNLELMAFLGYPVEYFEEESSFGGKRMEAYHVHDQHSGPDDRIGYSRTKHALPPTIKGKLLRSITERLTSEDKSLLVKLAGRPDYEQIKKALLDEVSDLEKGESFLGKKDLLLKERLLDSVAAKLTEADRLSLAVAMHELNYDEFKMALSAKLSDKTDIERFASQNEILFDVLTLIRNFSRIETSKEVGREGEVVRGYEYVETIQKDAYPVEPKVMPLLNMLVQLASKEYKYILRNYEVEIKAERGGGVLF